MGLSYAQRAFRRHRWGSLNIMGADIETLICEAIHRCPELEDRIDIDWIADVETARTVGWILVKYTGIPFQLGRRLLQTTAHDEYLMPPPEFQLCASTEPTPDEEYRAPMLHPWSVTLWQSGERPAEWQLCGRVYHPKWDCEQQWFKLLYLHRDKKMARTTDGWLRLGKRFAT